VSTIQKQKEILRRTAYDARNAEKDNETASKRAVKTLIALPEYKAAKTVMWYADCRSEMATQFALPAAIESGKRIAVPYCTTGASGENKLGLWHLQSIEELVSGKWKVLEPPREEWSRTEKQIQPEELDFVVVPGVAFSRDGARLGNGQGYYDRLLSSVRSDCALVGLSYESQLFEEVAMEPHDVYVNKVVTESSVYEGRGRVEQQQATA